MDKSLNAYSEFEALVYFLSEEEGGRSSDLSKDTKLQFYFRATDITGNMNLVDVKKASAGDNNVKIKVKLEKNVAMSVDDSFAIREGGKTIGKGYIKKIVK